MTLRQIAHARSGDKGNISNIAVFAYHPSDYVFLLAYLTTDRVRSHFNGIVQGQVLRYELPRLCALNFILNDALGGGVTRSLALDAHGKCYSSLLLDLELPADFQSTSA